MSWYGWRPYVPVAVRRARAEKKMEKLRKKGCDIQPVTIEGRKIAKTFWGAAWCDHLESFSDYENRLPRGRAYIRNGSVCHLDIGRGEINAMVSGSELYTVHVTIQTLPRKKWEDVKKRCAGQIGSLLELLQGRLSENVMSVVTDRNEGLFPLPREISLKCSCPDWAVMCKHVAAVLYGVGARLDEKPELLFLLRGVEHEELIEAELGVGAAALEIKASRRRIADEALADVFGIEMSEVISPPEKKPAARRQNIVPKVRKTPHLTTERKTKTKMKVGRKPSKTQKTRAGTKRAFRADSSPLPVTGKGVAGLRKKFGMSSIEFAKLLGVSTPSVINWEKKSGRLDLRARTFSAWKTAEGLTKAQAWRKLESAFGRRLKPAATGDRD